MRFTAVLIGKPRLEWRSVRTDALDGVALNVRSGLTRRGVNRKIACPVIWTGGA
jgi:hypothetical protein